MVVNSGTPVLTIISKELPEVAMSISEQEISSLEKAEEIYFLQKGKKYPLILKEISKKPEFSKLTYAVTMKFIEPTDLMVGAAGDVVVHKKNESTGEIKVPLSAIFEKGGTKVWVYDGGTVSSRDVVIERLADRGEAVIGKGLSSNEKVVAAGAAFLHEGARVKPIEEPSKSNVGRIL